MPRGGPQREWGRTASEESVCVRRTERYSLGFFGRQRFLRTLAEATSLSTVQSPNGGMRGWTVHKLGVLVAGAGRGLS